MTIEEIRKEYENSPDIVKTFNTLIDVTMSEFYHNKGAYLESLELKKLKILILVINLKLNNGILILLKKKL